MLNIDNKYLLQHDRIGLQGVIYLIEFLPEFQPFVLINLDVLIIEIGLFLVLITVPFGYSVLDLVFIGVHEILSLTLHSDLLIINYIPSHQNINSIHRDTLYFISNRLKIRFILD
jgi:hypothetical protein